MPQAQPLRAVKKPKSVVKPMIIEQPAEPQPSSNGELKKIIEAIIFASAKPLSPKQIQTLFADYEQPEITEIETEIASIIDDYRLRPIELKQVASGYRFQIRAGFSPWIGKLFEEKPPKYSRALLETLSIIAYRQPVTRGDIEDIRGVSVSTSIIQTLLERDWIKIVAYKEVPGKPALYGTTKLFLDYFNLNALSNLPTLQEVQQLELTYPIEVSREKS